MSASLRSWLEDYLRQTKFLTLYPYYAAVLARLEPVEDPRVAVMAVSSQRGRFYLHVNSTYFISPPQNIRYLRGVLQHEVHHVVLGHLSLEKFRRPDYPELMELAMEISANEYIREPLPEHPPQWTDFRHLGLSAGQSTLERYHLLVAAAEAGHLKVIPAAVDTHLPSGVGQVRTGASGGAWESERLRELVREAIKGTPGKGGLLAGLAPGQVLERLADAPPSPRPLQDWRTALEMFVSETRQPTRTYRRPSRRYPRPVGLVPGRLYQPTRDDPKSMLVALDTSGSMSTEELLEVARQLRRLDRLVDFTIVECDVVIQRVYPFNGVLDSVVGRGGTDLRPPFAAGLLRQYHPEGVIYFTDGFGPYLDADPGIRTLWVLTKGETFSCPWGRRAVLRGDEVRVHPR